MFIYIDADNFDSHQAEELLSTLKSKFGIMAQITVYLSCFRNFSNRKPDKINTHIHNNKRKDSQTRWIRACHNKGVQIHQLSPSSSFKNSTDIAIAVDVMHNIHLLQKDQNLISTTVVLVSGDSDFFYLVQRLKSYGVFVILIGHNKSNKRYSNCANRFCTIETLLKRETLPVSEAREYFKQYLSESINSDSIKLDRLEALLIEKSNGLFWPETYNCSSLSELLSQLNIPMTLSGIIKSKDLFNEPSRKTRRSGKSQNKKPSIINVDEQFEKEVETNTENDEIIEVLSSDSEYIPNFV
ncbi:hypothetical protein P9112_014010 [Eukaryota sp. TZLM1-RC]